MLLRKYTIAILAVITVGLLWVSDANAQITNKAYSDKNALDQLDRNQANDTSTAVFSTNASSDLSVVKTLLTSGFIYNTDSLDFSIVVNNDGPSSDNATVTDVIPVGLSFGRILSNTSGGSTAGESGGTITWSDIALASGGSATLVVRFAASTAADSNSTAIVNTASVDGNNFDAVAANNSDTGNVTILPLIDIDVLKSVNVTTAYEGDTVTYTIIVSNLGPDHATGVTVEDPIPGEVTFVPGSINVDPTAGAYGTASVTGTTLTFTGGIQEGKSVTITFKATVDAN